MTRRSFLSRSAAFGALAALPRALADWQPSQRYPDPLIKVIDPSFAKYRLALAKVEKIASGMRWAEGPVWFGDGRQAVMTDDAVLRASRPTLTQARCTAERVRPSLKPSGCRPSS